MILSNDMIVSRGKNDFEIIRGLTCTSTMSEVSTL